MTSHDVIGSLNEHLLRALKELKAKEGAWQEASSALERYQRKFAVVIHQQVLRDRELLRKHSCRWFNIEEFV